jgi:choline dehydrogenase-like flavoprotein
MRLTNPDAVIIGSGAGGGIAAKVLAEGGMKVLLLERGDNHFVGLDRPEGIVTNRFGNDELKFQHRAFLYHSPRIDPRTFRYSEDEEVSFVGDVDSLASTVGGSTIDYGAVSPRIQPKDLRTKTLFGQLEGTNIEDWPLSYDDLEPFFDEAEKTIGVQGEAGSNPFEGPRSSPFPMPPGYPKYNAELLADAARRLGYHPFPQPTAVNSVAYRGRPACANCGFCSNMGCAINAKGSTAVTAIRDALLTGNCELRPNSFVYLLKTNSSGTRIESVEYIGPKGEKVVQQGGIFILACNAIESTRLCLLSANSAHPTGLGNRSDMVGRNLMFHHEHLTIGVFPNRLHPYRGRTTTQMMDDFNRPPDPDDPNKVFGGGVWIFGGTLNPIAYAKNLPLIGKSHKSWMRDSEFREYIASIEIVGEEPPVLTNRADLDPHVRDVNGFPVARITYKSHPNDQRAAEYYRPKIEEILWEAGAVSVLWVDDVRARRGPSSNHISGTMRMGTDPDRSVTDPYGKFHDVENLYCADGGLFVTSTSYNPTMTQQALAARQAHHILE